jgi:hypothetical protein
VNDTSRQNLSEQISAATCPLWLARCLSSLETGGDTAADRESRTAGAQDTTSSPLLGTPAVFKEAPRCLEFVSKQRECECADLAKTARSEKNRYFFFSPFSIIFRWIHCIVAVCLEI